MEDNAATSMLEDFIGGVEEEEGPWMKERQ